MPRKKQLPKDFEALLEQGDLEALKRVFETHEIDARGGIFKQTALAFDQCPDALARWLVERGADLAAADAYGDTPLHARSRHWRGRIEVLLELGADPNRGENLRGTPLHAAAEACNETNVRLLLANGARADALDQQHQTPLARALARCSNAQIQHMAVVAEMLLAAGAQRTPEMSASVARIGSDFEFHRQGFNRELVEATSAGLDTLYALFDVTPAPRRQTHDGRAPIVARAVRWEDQHRELWQLLVPSSGAASTVQGEVVRISGRIQDELDGNGGINWDAGYKKMADAFLEHVATGAPLTDAQMSEAAEIVAAVKRKVGDARRLCELAVIWVASNPAPVKLPPPDYDR